MGQVMIRLRWVDALRLAAPFISFSPSLKLMRSGGSPEPQWSLP
jgi:hypothetical protein